MDKVQEEAIKLLEKYEDKIVTEEVFQKLEQIENVYYINNGTSGRSEFVGCTWYSFYLVEDGVTYENCEKKHIGEYSVYL